MFEFQVESNLINFLKRREKLIIYSIKKIIRNIRNLLWFSFEEDLCIKRESSMMIISSIFPDISTFKGGKTNPNALL